MAEITDPKLLEQLNAHVAAERVPAKSKTADKGVTRFGNATEVLVGVSQGLIDPVEGLVQLAEKSSGWKLAPDSVRKFARDWRNRAQSSYAGIGGEVVGNVLPFLASGGSSAAGTAASLLPRAARVAPLLERVTAGAVAGGLQPVSGDSDYLRTKLEQAAGGAVLGGAVPSLANLAGRVPHSVLSHTGLPRWLTRPMTAPITAATGAVAGVPAGTYGAVSGQFRGMNPYEREDAEPGATPARTPSAPSAPPGGTPIDDESLMSLLSSLAGRTPARSRSGLGGLAGEAVDKVYGGRDAETQ